MLPPTSSPSHGLISAPIGQAIHRLLLIQAFRPDRLLAMAHMFVSTNLGDSFMSIMEQPLDLTHIVDTEVRSGPADSEPSPFSRAPPQGSPPSTGALSGGMLSHPIPTS